MADQGSFPSLNQRLLQAGGESNFFCRGEVASSSSWSGAIATVSQRLPSASAYRQLNLLAADQLETGGYIISKPSKDWTDAEIYHEISQIIREFGILECADCARAIRRWLRHRGISGKLLRLRTRYGEDYILSDRLEQLGIRESMTTNGQHFGVEVRGRVFDNLSEQGQPRELWVQDFQCHSGQFVVTEMDSW